MNRISVLHNVSCTSLNQEKLVKLRAASLLGKMKEAAVRVEEAYPEDVGGGVVRVDMDVMRMLGLTCEDVVEVTGKSKAVGVPWPCYPKDAGKGIIRIDRELRRSAGVRIGGKAKIRRADVCEAKMVSVALTRRTAIAGGVRYLHRMLLNRPVMQGQRIRVDILGNPLILSVTSTEPSGAVTVTARTKVCVAEG